MNYSLPTEGAASADVMAMAADHWRDAALRHGINLEGYDARASLKARIAWARERGLKIATVLARHSTRMQHSTTAQVADCLEYAASHGIYVPPEHICVDEGVSGRKNRRAGLERMREILRCKLVDILLVYKSSRLFRVAYRGFQLIQEDVVDEGLRAISVSQQIDTADESTWKKQLMLHGLMDEMLLDTVADDVSIRL